MLTESTKTPEAVEAFAVRLAGRLRTAGHDLSDAQVGEALRGGRRRYAEHKDGATPTREVGHREFWADLVGDELAAGPRAWLAAESAALAFEYAHAKSRAWLRAGVADLLEWCRAQGLPVAIVSNTICGRSGRRRLREAGVAHLIAAHLYSDEVGWRKPDPTLVHEAARALDVPVGDCWFVGDKPWRDVAAGRAAGVGATVIVRTPAIAAEGLEAALAADPTLTPDLLLDDMAALHLALAALVGQPPTDPRHPDQRKATA